MPPPEVPVIAEGGVAQRFNCGEPMRIIAFVLDRPQVERILEHIGEPTQRPVVLPARSPPQLAFGFDQTPAGGDWPDMDQTAGQADGWE